MSKDFPNPEDQPHDQNLSVRPFHKSKKSWRIPSKMDHEEALRRILYAATTALQDEEHGVRIQAICDDCGKMMEEHTFYMVWPELWEEHGAGKGFLHLPCLERRMGRELRLSDFNEAPLNGLIRWAWIRGNSAFGME